MSNKYTVGVTLINSCFHEDILSNAIPPDSITVSNYSDIKIPFDFVLCRDHLNNVTAMFGSNRWDFNPYRLSANKITVIDFDQMCDSGDNSVTNELVFEVKYILFHLIYSVPAGFTGMLSPGTLINYYGVLRKAAKYCEKISAEGLYFGKKTLKDLFSDKTLFLAFVTEHEKLSFNSKAAALVKHLLYLGESILKFRIHTIADALIKRLDNEQTVVIPQRIYMLIADNLEKDINHIHQNSLRLTDFIKEFRDPFYGISETTQKNRAVGGTKNFRLTMDSAIAQYGLNKLFSGHLSVTNRNNLRSTITKIQYLCKLTLHFYTGMRNQEVQRLFCGSIGKHATSKAVLDELGKEIDAARMVEVVSSTTKFTGRRQDASWIATSEVKNAICILERIHEGLSALVDVNLKDDWLFISSDYIKSRGC